jgi:hypothetical protein
MKIHSPLIFKLEKFVKICERDIHLLQKYNFIE